MCILCFVRNVSSSFVLFCNPFIFSCKMFMWVSLEGVSGVSIIGGVQIWHFQECDFGGRLLKGEHCLCIHS